MSSKVSVSRPAATGNLIFGINDENTGLNSPAANTMTVVTGGTARVQVNSTEMLVNVALNAASVLLSGNATFSTASIAAAGTVQANATAVTAMVTTVSGADDAKGVVLGASDTSGTVRVVYSSQATNGLKVYPGVNNAFNDGSANSAIVIEGKSMAVFVKTTNTNWGAIYTANT